ncbi:hypothetical protein [Paenibacillus sp. HB172176]|uniref:hypothetical protein n=1 Tax=Paenibacillus sp. HB172176 TaxID=2493690 RepID=UPI00143ACE10|nr:hypothetical protein [Paenibacillus sp. HB172176]
MIEKKQLTVRLPKSVIEYIQEKAKKEKKALNDVMTDITEEYMKWHESEQLLQDIFVIRERVKNEYGVHPDSTEEIRDLRDGDR